MPPTLRPGWKRWGPVTWVPEFGLRESDPWAHRKGEPRPLALMWALYLMASATLTIFGVRSLSMPTTGQFVTACRGMLVMALIGTVVLWPMLRLSQEAPARPWRALAGDLLVLLLPLQVVTWPMPLLTKWPWEVVAGLSACGASWTLLAGMCIVCALRAGGGTASRGMGSAACVATAIGAPVVMALWPAGMEPAPAWMGMLSPLSAMYHLAEAPSGLAPSMSRAEWVLSLLPGLVALGLGALAMASGPARPSSVTTVRTDPSGGVRNEPWTGRSQEPPGSPPDAPPDAPPSASPSAPEDPRADGQPEAGAGSPIDARAGRV